MKVLMISTDRKILETESVVSTRTREYAKLVDELRVVLLARKEGEGWLRAMCNVYGECNKIIKSWGKKKIIVLTSQDGLGHILVAMLSLQFKFGWEAQIHTDILSPYFLQRSWKNYVQLFGYWIAGKRASGLRVVSIRIKHSIISRWRVAEERILVLPIFVDVVKFANVSATDLRQKYSQFDHIILMASRFTKEKNIALAFDVLKLVHKRYPKTGILIAGEGLLRSELEIKTKTYPPAERAGNLTPNTYFLLWQTSEQLAELYKSADVFLLTSNYEGYGQTLVEAAAAGCAIVTTDVGLVGEVVNAHNALIAPVGDADKLAQHISFLFQNVKAREMMSERLQTAIQNLPDKEATLSRQREHWVLCGQRVIGGLPMIARYIISGGTAAFTDIALLYFFTSVLGIWYLISAILAFLFAFWVSFFMQKHWTFQDNSGRTHAQAVNYFVVAVINLSVNTLLMYYLVDLLHVWYLLAQIIVGGLIAFSSFFIYRRFIFKNSK